MQDRSSKDEFLKRFVEFQNGALQLLQPAEAAALPDDGPIAWAPIAPYSEVLWRSGVALAEELETERLQGLQVVELGCGLGAAQPGGRPCGRPGDLPRTSTTRRCRWSERNAREGNGALGSRRRRSTGRDPTS